MINITFKEKIISIIKNEGYNIYINYCSIN